MKIAPDLGRYAICGPKGWQTIIDDLFKELSEDCEVIQVKQKFGELRVYARNQTDEDDVAIRKAVMEAGHTCEHCGSSNAALVNNEYGWLTVLCDACRKTLDD